MKLRVDSQGIKMIVMVSLMCIMFLYVAVQYYFVPTAQAVSSIEKQVRSAQDKLKSLEASTANQEALRIQYQQVEQAVAGLRMSLPKDSELPAVMEVLSDLAAKANVKIQTIFPERAATATGKPASGDPTVFREIPIQIDALSGYHELGKFLNQVEVGDKPMQVLSLRIISNPKDIRKHQINLLLKAYFAFAEDAEDNDA